MSKEIITVSAGDIKMSEAIFENTYDNQRFIDHFTYTGNDLGVTYTKECTRLRVWSPLAKTVNVLLFNNGDPQKDPHYVSKVPMAKDVNGTWVATLWGDFENKFYLYELDIDNSVVNAVDPYAKAVGVNGLRGAIVDLVATDPDGFRTYKKPAFLNPTDAIIYELHVRDLSIDDHSGITHKGKFLGTIETGATTPDGLTTGIDHIKELGVTHVHLLPVFDFKTVDESKPDELTFNWGYDPLNYNVPEGSYATNPFDPTVRIREFKQMVQGMNANNIRVIMDVVYNHTYTADDSNLNTIVPRYYHRTDENGVFTDGSGCGNETASERPMVRKFMVDSVVYWATEYRVDGFRFDLMGLHDIETMNCIREALNKIDPTLLMYGEGWTGASSPLPEKQQAIKANAPKLDAHIAMFSDDMRDGIRGSVFKSKEPGFVNSGSDRDQDVKFGMVGSVYHPQIDISKIHYSTHFWANAPTQTVNYASAHDNLTLWDKLLVTNPNDTPDELVKMNKLSAAIVLTSQGIPFIHAGEEIARTKDGDENSYKSPDRINKISWARKGDYLDLYAYYKGLIALRKHYRAFRLTDAKDVQSNIQFVDTDDGLIIYSLKNTEDTGYKQFLLIFNATLNETVFSISNPADVLVNGQAAGIQKINTVIGELRVSPRSAFILGVEHESFEIKRIQQKKKLSAK